jgi:F-type H+-transporting ATPase subunit b
MLNPVLLFNNIIMLIQQHEDKPSLLSVNPGLIIWTIVIFVILLILLRKIAWGPLLTALNNREESIKNAIKNAEKLNADAQRLIEENKKNLAEANAQSMKIINESKEMANKVREEMISKANADARKIVEQAQHDIEHQKDAALNELRDKISDIAINAAEKIIKETLDESKQKKIVNDFLTQVPKN